VGGSNHQIHRLGDPDEVDFVVCLPDRPLEIRHWSGLSMDRSAFAAVGLSAGVIAAVGRWSQRHMFPRHGDPRSPDSGLLSAIPDAVDR
jgi:hypothetical protein